MMTDGLDRQQTRFETPPEIRTITFRRIAISFVLLVELILGGAIVMMGRPACASSSTCGRTVFLVAMAVTIPAVFILSWVWGRWHARRIEYSVMRLEREFREQVNLVDWERRRLATVLNQMADGVIMANEDGRILYLNPAATRLMKTTQEEAQGASFPIVAFHPQLIDLWQKCRQEKTEQTAAVEIDNNYFVQVVLSPFRLLDRLNFLIILQDLSHVRRLETIRRDFITNVSHELLTPLSSLRALVETLRESALDDPPAADRFLSRAQDEVDAMSQIVGVLLTLSRIESGQVPLRLSWVSCSELLLPPVERLRIAATRKEVTLAVDIPQNTPAVLADMEQIWQVLTKILHNALKYTPEGGKITVRARQGTDDGQVVLAVADTGIGIPLA